jgi:hypothetical protein
VLSAAVDDVLKTQMKPVEGPPFHNVPTAAELGTISPRKMDIAQTYAAFDALLKAPRQRYERLLFMARDGKFPDHYPYGIEVWQFGSSLKFIAISGEVVVDYSLRLKSQYGWDTPGWRVTRMTCSVTHPRRVCCTRAIMRQTSQDTSASSVRRSKS